MSETPRTDEAEFYVDHFDGNFTEILVTRSNLPRQLERELAAKAEECEELKRRFVMTSSDHDDAGPFGRLEIIDRDRDGKPLRFGNVAITMRNGMWMGTHNGFPAGDPALYSRERAERIVEAWNAALREAK